jgi:hypothetical protein
MAAGETILQRWTKFLAVVCPLLLTAILAAGQAASPSTLTPKSDNKAVADSEAAPPLRLFGFIPNSKSVNDTGQPVPPLTPEGKFRLVEDYFSFATLLRSAFGAGIGQATNSAPRYRQGWEGYGKRVGADLADGLTSEVFVTGVFPSLLHQDPRYFRRGHGTNSSRLFYAVTRVVVTRTDSGRHTFNMSQVLGSLASSGISNSYYPQRDRGWDDFMSRAGTNMASKTLSFALREFGPDIMRKFRRKKPPQEDSPAIGIPVKN